MPAYKEVTGKFRDYDGDVGIEIEVESREPLNLNPGAPWDVKREGSLRHHGAEYYTLEPLKVDEHLNPALKKVCDHINQAEPLKNSPRTSIHVHANMLPFDVLHIYNIMCAYWLMENVIVRWCGPHREGNLFCLRAKDAEAVIDAVRHDIMSQQGTKAKPFSSLNVEGLKYGALNVGALSMFGSLEFRPMRGTTDPKLIYGWAKELWNMCRKSKQFHNPGELVDAFFGMEKEEFMNMFFSNEFVTALKREAKGEWEDMIEENIGMVSGLSYCTDWGKFNDRLVKLAEDRKKAKGAKKKSSASWDDLWQDEVHVVNNGNANFRWNPPPGWAENEQLQAELERRAEERANNNGDDDDDDHIDDANNDDDEEFRRRQREMMRRAHAAAQRRRNGLNG